MWTLPSQLAHYFSSLLSLSNVITAAIVLLIIVVYWRSRLRIHMPIKAIAEALHGATRRVEGLPSDTPVKVFPTGPDKLRDLWREFLEQRNENTVLYRGRQISTLDPSDIFHEQALFGASSRQLAGTLAGILTGIGIFGTFIGLVLGIARVDTNDMIGSVGNLLGGMWTAFVTSLFGIGTSLLWLYMDRRSQDELRDAVQGFFIRVRARYPVEGADRLLHRLLDVEQEESAAIQESKGILLEQKGILQTLSTDLALAFERAVTEGLEAALGPQLARMTDAVQSLSINIGDRQVAALGEMVEAFQSRLSEELHGQLEGLAKALENASEWQERVYAELDVLVTRVETASERQLHLIEAANDASGALVGSLDHLQQTAESIAKIAAETERAAGAVTAAGMAMQDQAASLKAENDVYREANERIRLALARQIEALEGKVDEVEAFWNKVGEDLEAAGQKLKTGANEFGILASDKLGEIFHRFDAEMAKVVGHLSGTLAEIREVTEELPATLDELKGTLSSQAAGVQESMSVLAETMDVLRSFDRIPEVVKEMPPLADSFSKSVEGLGAAGAALDKLAQRIRALPAELTEQFQIAIAKGHEDGQVVIATRLLPGAEQ